jgi:hypothetical protein
MRESKDSLRDCYSTTSQTRGNLSFKDVDKPYTSNNACNAIFSSNIQQQVVAMEISRILSPYTPLFN